MERHLLFQLNPWFEENGDGPFYCPDCGIVEGFFRYSPEVQEKLEIHHIDFQRPRHDVIAVLGEENQGCPVLVLARGVDAPAGAKTSMSTGRFFLDDPVAICDFLGRTFQVPRPHP